MNQNSIYPLIVTKTESKNKFVVSCKYNEEFIKNAKLLNGIYDPVRQTWMFNLNQKIFVLTALDLAFKTSFQKEYLSWKKKNYHGKQQNI